MSTQARKALFGVDEPIHVVKRLATEEQSIIMASHVTSGQQKQKQWYQHITIDLLALILQRSIFHPFIAWLIPLCQRAVGAPYESFEFRATCTYAAFITLLWMLGVANKRLAYGLPRELNWDEEVVVITGGASGLGKILAEMYGMRGASVAVLDVQEPEKESEGLAGVQLYQCDVGDAAAVQKVKDQIEKNVCSYTYTSPPSQALIGKLSSAHQQSS